MATTEQAADPKQTSGAVHGGRLVARALKSRGVSKLFTLSGGHLFSIYDGCKEEGIEVVDFRHEQSATFAAIGWAKATREPGVAALTAGCGVTNGMSAIATAQADNVPLMVMGGRAPEMRWGSGSLQEMDHVPFVVAAGEVGRDGRAAADIPAHDRGGDRPGDGAAARADVRGLPTRRRLHGGRGRGPAGRRPEAAVADGVEEAAKLLAGAERPAIMAGTNVYWGGAEKQLQALAESLGIPVFLNGMGRGCMPPSTASSSSCAPAPPGSAAATLRW